MGKPFRVVVFGKAGCDKCKLLQKRLGEVLAAGEWDEFEPLYADVETVEGLVAFCRAECLNPQRIPAVLVLRAGPDGASWAPVPAPPAPAGAEALYGKSRLANWVGLQTDYGPAGRGVLSPRMLRAMLKEARQAEPAPRPA
jgi:hypothetical protein